MIESTGYVSSKGLQMIEGIKLPLQCASLCSTSIDVQRMAVKAAVNGDVELLKLAVLQDPLVSSVCSSEEVWQMVDEMLVAQEKWLPQFKSKINSIKRNLKKIKNNPTQKEKNAKNKTSAGVFKFTAKKVPANTPRTINKPNVFTISKLTALCSI